MSVECRTIPMYRPCGESDCERPECNTGKSVEVDEQFMTIPSSLGIRFKVVYGRRQYTDGSYSEKPVVAFYDTRHKGYTEHGQFCGSDYDIDRFLNVSRYGWGLDVHGGVPEWTIDATTLYVISIWLNHVVMQEEN